MHCEALEFFKVGNNFTMIYRCVTEQLTSFSILIETGNFFANLLQFERAKEMYQKAFDQSDTAEKKRLAWK